MVNGIKTFIIMSKPVSYFFIQANFIFEMSPGEELALSLMENKEWRTESNHPSKRLKKIGETVTV
jgi:hypothetical protein